MILSERSESKNLFVSSHELSFPIRFLSRQAKLAFAIFLTLRSEDQCNVLKPAPPDPCEKSSLTLLTINSNILN